MAVTFPNLIRETRVIADLSHISLIFEDIIKLDKKVIKDHLPWQDLITYLHLLTTTNAGKVDPISFVHSLAIGYLRNQGYSPLAIASDPEIYTYISTEFERTFKELAHAYGMFITALFGDKYENIVLYSVDESRVVYKLDTGKKPYVKFSFGSF